MEDFPFPRLTFPLLGFYFSSLFPLFPPFLLVLLFSSLFYTNLFSVGVRLFLARGWLGISLRFIGRSNPSRYVLWLAQLIQNIISDVLGKIENKPRYTRMSCWRMHASTCCLAKGEKVLGILVTARS